MATFLLASVALAFGAVVVVLAQALGRYAVARLTKLPIARARLRIFVPLDGPGRTRARLGALAAGSAVAYVSVFAFAFAFAVRHGLPTGEMATFVFDTLPGYDAAGKLERGDQIIAVDGEPLFPGLPPTLTERVDAKDGAPVTLTVRRAGALLDVTIQPKRSEHAVRGRPRWRLGLQQSRRQVFTTDAAEGAAFAIRYPFEQARVILDEHLATPAAYALGIVGLVVFLAIDEPEPAEEPGGPVRIAEEFHRVPVWERRAGWQLALFAAAYTMLVLVLLDLVRAASIAFAHRRRDPGRPAQAPSA